MADPWVRVRRSFINRLARYAAQPDLHGEILKMGYEIGREAAIHAGYQAGYDLGYDHGTSARQDCRQFVHGVMDGFEDGAWEARMMAARMVGQSRPARQEPLPGTESVSRTWVDRA